MVTPECDHNLIQIRLPRTEFQNAWISWLDVILLLHCVDRNRLRDSRAFYATVSTATSCRSKLEALQEEALLFPHPVPTYWRPFQPPFQCVSTTSGGVKRPRREANHSYPFRVEVLTSL